MHEDLLPPESLDGFTEQEMADWKTEYDVLNGLRRLGHDARPVGISDDLSPLRKEILEWKPHVVFMLIEEFHGVAVYDMHVVSYLELMRQPYTGCNPRGLLITHDKPLMKKILTYHRVPTPRFTVYRRGRSVKPPASKRLAYPLLVKSSIEDASLGIAQKSIVRNDERLVERVEFIHEHVKSDAIVEEYVEGRELYVGVMGNLRLEVLPIWEMTFENLPDGSEPIATAKAKWDLEYQKKLGIKTGRAKGLSQELEAQIAQTCRRAYRRLEMTGYGRMDLRLTEDGRVYVIEANANPNLEYGEDIAESAAAIGISYERLLQRVVNLGLAYRAPWRS